MQKNNNSLNSLYHIEYINNKNNNKYNNNNNNKKGYDTASLCWLVKFYDKFVSYHAPILAQNDKTNTQNQTFTID